MTNALKNQAMLVVLSVSSWTGRVQDKKISDEIDRAHGAVDAGRYNKLLVDKVYLDPITKFSGALRTYHYKMTRAWGDNGSRILPSALFMEWSAEIRNRTFAFEQLVDDFINIYDHRLIQDASRRLGTMYDPADYPPGYELRSKFGITTDVMPIPDGEDFRVDIGDTERKRIAQEIDERVVERAKTAERESWDKVREVVTTIQTRLSAEKVIVRDSLIENAKELTRLLPGLNFSRNPKMTEVCDAITNQLIIHPDTLRNSRSARAHAVKAAGEILGMIP